MRLQAFLWSTGLVVSPHNTAAPSPAPGKGVYDMAEVFRMNNEQFLGMVDNILAVGNANPTDYGWTAADLAALAEVKTDLQTKVDARITAAKTAKATTTAARGSRSVSDETLRVLYRKAMGQPTLTPAQATEIGLKIRDANPSPVTPNTPTRLVVNGQDNGINLLKWDRNGNTNPTQYIIEARIAPAATFSMIDSVTRTVYEHEGVTPGVKAEYRVRARRATRMTGYSNVAIVYAMS